MKSFNGYITELDKLSPVKLKILRRLWDKDGTPFPKPWVASSILLELTEQKYFDRRTRELRDEYGCDIENGHINGEHAYRLLSDELKSAKPREYLTESEKRDLFERYDFTCQICGTKMDAGVRGLQADHKVPLIRGGLHVASNWQPICNVCNVGKRRACAGCSDDCQKCPWAFPERVGQVSLIRMPPEMLSAIRHRSGNDHKDFEALVIALLRDGLKLP